MLVGISSVIKQIEDLEEKKLTLETFLGINKPLGEDENSRQRRNVGTMKGILEILEKNPRGLSVRDVLHVIARDKLPIKAQSVSSSLSYAFDKGLVTRDGQGVYRLQP